MKPTKHAPHPNTVRARKKRLHPHAVIYALLSALLLCALAIQYLDYRQHYIPASTYVHDEIFYADGKIFINAADADILSALPGVGPVLSQRIVDYREAHGFLSGPEDLLLIEGLGESNVQNILPYLNFSTPAPSAAPTSLLESAARLTQSLQPETDFSEVENPSDMVSQAILRYWRTRHSSFSSKK